MQVSEETDGGNGEVERARLQVRYRRYLVATALISLLVGGVVGALGFDDAVMHPVGPTPPASWLTPVGQQAAVVLTMPPTVTPPLIHVYVSGAVAQPQVVALPAGSLIEDAIEAAGGALPTSDLEALNLAARLRDHDHVKVPEERAETSDDLTAPAGAAERIDINSASVAMLDALPSIGPTRAAEIVAYREAHGPFTTTEALLDVPGIGPGIYADIEPWITTE
jgi:competence protein ComEA